jgi:hypothetical protein
LADNELLIKINADTSNAEKKFDSIKKQTESLSDALKEVSKVSAIAFATLTAEIGFSIAAYKEAESASNSLTAALQSQGIFTVELRDKYKGYADEIERATGIDNDAIIAAQALAQRHIGQIEITERLTKAIVDFSVAQKVDLNEASNLISKSIGSQVNVLARYGLQLNDTATRSERYAKVLQFLEGNYGKSADAANQGLGSLHALATAFGDLQEEIGARFAPAVSAGAAALTKVINAAKDNKELLNFGVALITAAGAVAGLITGATLLAQALITVRAAAIAAGIAITGTRFALQALLTATVIGAVIVALTELAIHWNTVFPAMEATFRAFAKHVSDIAGGLADILQGIFLGFHPEKVQAGFAKLKEVFSKGYGEIQDDLKANQKKNDEIQNAGQAETSAINEKQRVEEENRRKTAQAAKLSALKAEVDLENQTVIDSKQKEAQITEAIAQNKNANELALLQQKLEQQKAITAQAEQDQLDSRAEFAAAQDATDADLAEQRLANTEILNAQQIQAAENLAQSELQISQKIANDKLTEEIKAHNLLIEERKRYGIAVATIDKALHSTEIEGAKSVSGELVALAQSKQSTLKAIGKAASIAQITIATAESAVNIAKSVIAVVPFPFAIPIAGALAAARIAFGAEQIANVTAAASGALVGGSGNGDTQPFLLEPGELVAPKKNFEEVVGAVNASRNNRDDDIVNLLTSLNEKNTAGGSTIVVQGDVMAESSYIDKLVTHISDALEFRNAKLFGVNT